MLLSRTVRFSEPRPYISTSVNRCQVYLLILETFNEKKLLTSNIVMDIIEQELSKPKHPLIGVLCLQKIAMNGSSL
jgi:hypothetical protein